MPKNLFAAETQRRRAAGPRHLKLEPDLIEVTDCLRRQIDCLTRSYVLANGRITDIDVVNDIECLRVALRLCVSVAKQKLSRGAKRGGVQNP